MSWSASTIALITLELKLFWKRFISLIFPIAKESSTDLQLNTYVNSLLYKYVELFFLVWQILFLINIQNYGHFLAICDLHILYSE